VYGIDRDEVVTGGDDRVKLVYGVDTVEAAQPSSGITVTRGISPSSVPAEGGEVTVTITITGAYSIGSVVEKLPAGFNYVGGSVIPTDIEPEVDGQDLRFPLLGELSFTYKVMTSASAGPHNFPVERLPAGFSYVDESVMPALRQQAGLRVGQERGLHRG
jgi:hypothetical protein